MSDDTKALAPMQSAGQVSDLFRLAIDKGISVEGLEKLVMLHERIADRSAGQEFAEALAGFQNDCPSISKESRAEITPRSGIKYGYNYAELDRIVEVVRPILHKYGLAFSWDSGVEGPTLSCVCTLRHINGHKEKATFACPTESRAGMSVQQAHAGALTFARRQALVQVLGLTTCEPDSDGATVGPTISEKQVADLEALISEVGANKTKYLKLLKVANLDKILASDYKFGVRVLTQMRK